MNATFIQQNLELQNDNKQLAVLLKEYEQTLETVMNKFRTQAVRVIFSNSFITILQTKIYSMHHKSRNSQ
jgi:SIKE family